MLRDAYESKKCNAWFGSGSLRPKGWQRQFDQQPGPGRDRHRTMNTLHKRITIGGLFLRSP